MLEPLLFKGIWIPKDIATEKDLYVVSPLKRDSNKTERFQLRIRKALIRLKRVGGTKRHSIIVELSSLKFCFLKLKTSTPQENPFFKGTLQQSPALQVSIYSSESRTAKPAQDRFHHKVYFKHAQKMENLM